MRFKEYLEDKYQYLGQCDKLRMCGNNEAWQNMMSQKQPISKEEFVATCDISPILEDDEPDQAIDDFTVGDPNPGFYKSVWGETPACFLQTHGFEFIFVKPS
jgi:hypothetical protein